MQEKVLDIEFVGVDDWSKPIFKLVGKEAYFCSTTTLVPDKEKGIVNNDDVVNYFKQNPEELELHGSSFDCDTLGGRSPIWKFNIIS